MKTLFYQKAIVLLITFFSIIILSRSISHFPQGEVAAQANNQIILPEDGKVTVNFISTGGPGDQTICTGDFGLDSPQNILIYPNYLYFAGVPFPIEDYYAAGTELIFYLAVAPGSVCNVATYYSTDPSRAIVEHQPSNRWTISWEDHTDNDFNDLVVEVIFEPSIIPFLDLPFDYSGSNFAVESRDTEQGGKIDAYIDHQYPTYCNPPNMGGCSASDTRAVNFYGYDGGVGHPQPPYRVVYNGHDGTDYKGSGIPVLTAASGTVTFAGQISTLCSDGVSRDANVVKIRHENDYVTEYWHLSAIAPGTVINSSVSRDPSNPIGWMGSTGCVTGPHLHFITRNPNGIVVDPYGWNPKPESAWFGQEDPWQEYHLANGGQDSTSHYLWLHSLETVALIDPDAITVINSPAEDIVANFPTGIYSDPLRVELAESSQSAEVRGYETVRSFLLYGYTIDNNLVSTLDNEFTLSIVFGDALSAYTSTSTTMSPKIFIWESQSAQWQALAMTWDASTNTLTATSIRLGTFTVVVPAPIYLPLILSAP